MKCLIPVHQELYPENAIKRAERLCDKIVLVYIVDKKLMEKVQSEASYILPSFALENVEEFILNMHRQEAEKIRASMTVPAKLKFVVGEYYESIERGVLRERPDIIMLDHYLRGLLKMNVPIWIDRGGEIMECTMIVTSLKKIGKIKRGVELATKICERIGSVFYIHYPPGDAEGKNALKPLGSLIDTPRGELFVLLKENIYKAPEKTSVLLI